jgi:4a-hydroxytetrahydrobiopterin dehydratase
VTGASAGSPHDEWRALAAQHCGAGAPQLAADQLRDRLACLPGWTHAGNRIEKTFHFADYHRTIAFVNAVAAVAHAEDHHPDLAVHYDRCTVAWSTHSAGGVTLNDCICAAKLEALAA